MATETVHQNGHVSGDGDSAPPGDATPEELIADTAEEDAVEDESSAQPSGVAEPVTEKSVEQKLYFFRLPYPDLSVDDGNIEKLRMEFERFKTEYELISAQMKGVKAQKDEARAETDAAREIFHSAKKEADKVRAVLNPLQGGSAETREAVAKFKNLHAPPFESEEKLDKRIAELEHSQAHESLTIREEKAVIKELQKLQKSRNVVREFEKLNADLVVAREAAEQTKSRRQDLQNELRTLKEEEGKAFEVLRQFEAAGKSFTDTLNELYQSLKEARAKKDERYDAWKEARAARRVKLDEFHANRDFSKKIRGMVKNGEIEEARALCNEQMETHLQKLKDEPAWAKQYFELWAEQRRPTITDAEIESDVQDAKAAAAQGKGAKGKAKEQQTKKSAAAPVSNEPSPADLVAAALRSAEEELNKARGARTALEQQASSRPDAQETDTATGSSPSTAPQPSAKPEKKAPKPRASEPLPEVHIDDTFVPPPQAQQQVKLSEAELKAKVREEQRQKMEEAMQRKALRKAKNERRKQRVQERKAQEALEAQETEQVTTDADTATDVETDMDESAAMTREAELPEAEAKPVISAQQRKKMAKGAYAATRIAQKADGPRPMPKGVKKPSFVRQLKQFGQDYGPYVAIVVSGVTILTMTWGMVAQS